MISRNPSVTFSFFLFTITFLLTACSGSNPTRLLVQEIPVKEDISTLLKGQVTNDSDSAPVEAASVYLENTSFQTETDEEGRFSFTNVPAGYYILHIKKDNYESKSESIHLNDRESNEWVQNYTLTPGGNMGTNGSYEDDTEIADLLDHETEIRSRLDALRDSLIQTRNQLATAFENSIIRESEDPFFEPFMELVATDNWKSCAPISWEAGGLKAINDGIPEMEILKPFRFNLINYDTGYLIEVIVKGFKGVDDGLGINYGIEKELVFSELWAANEEARDRWERNRKSLYEGSLREFLTALATGNYLTEGYKVYGGQYSSRSYTVGSAASFGGSIEISKDEFYGDIENGKGNYLKYPNSLKVEYVKRFMGYDHDYDGLKGFEYETSFIEFNSSAAYFSDNGTLEDPDAIRLSGLWGFRKICNELPFDYKPN